MASAQCRLATCSRSVCVADRSSSTKHIFISYNHGSKKTVLRLRDQLKAAGFMVWVDEEGVCTYLLYLYVVTSPSLILHLFSVAAGAGT